MGAFKEPHGSEPKDLHLDRTVAEDAKQAARNYASSDLTEPQLCDIRTPENAQMANESVDISPDLAMHRILVKLESMGFIQ